MSHRDLFAVIFSAVTLCGLIAAWGLFLTDSFIWSWRRRCIFNSVPPANLYPSYFKLHMCWLLSLTRITYLS